jgi:hypothetical protein
MPEASQITHDERHRVLVRRLATKVKPTRRLWPVEVRLGLWIILEVGVLAWVATHTDNDFVRKLKQPAYASEVIFFAAASVISAALALRSAIPGRPLRAIEATLAVMLVVTGTAFVTAAEPMNTSNPLSEFVRTGLRCSYETWLFAAPALLVLWWMVHRGASMSGRLSGLLVGAGALFFSLAIMRVRCPIDEPLHILVWHVLPALVLIALSTLAGGVWLRFHPLARRPDPTN